jgi:hypothetical protein
MKQYVVELTSEERSQLQQIVAKGNTTGYRIKYAHILLKADQGKGGPGWSDPKIAEAFAIYRPFIGSVSDWLKMVSLLFYSMAIQANANNVNWMAKPKPI